MYKLINFIVISMFLSSNVFADSYIATRQELWFSDSSYYKTSHHVKIGKSIVLNNYNIFGEVGIGEDIDEGIVDASAAKGQSQPILVHSKGDNKSKTNKTTAA